MFCLIWWNETLWDSSKTQKSNKNITISLSTLSIIQNCSKHVKIHHFKPKKALKMHFFALFFHQKTAKNGIFSSKNSEKHPFYAVLQPIISANNYNLSQNETAMRRRKSILNLLAKAKGYVETIFRTSMATTQTTGTNSYFVGISRATIMTQLT